jgi:hypothetical protein
MIRFLYHSYNLLDTSTSIIGKLLAKVFRKLTLLISIMTLPVYFSYVRIFKLKQRQDTNTGITITLTSFPARIKNVYQVVISLMLQSYPVRDIVLYLSKEQFSSMNEVPKSLRNLIPYGLKLIFVEGDIRSYKKYIYNKDSVGDIGFIIVDDDIVYHPDTVSLLLDTSKIYPKSVCANRCVLIDASSKYKNWKLATNCGEGQYMATGCAGVYYPPSTLDDMAYDITCAWNNSPDGDDIWLKAAAVVAETPVVYTGFSQLLLPVFNKNAFDLHTKNVQGELNDINLNRVNDFIINKYGKGLFDES